MNKPLLERVERAVRARCESARRKHPAHNSLHESYAIIVEELDKFWAYVCYDREADARAELTYLAAAVMLALHDAYNRDPKITLPVPE